MDDGDGGGRGEDDAGQAPSPRTTIVGGRPPEEGPGLPRVPTGIQRLLRYATAEEAFLEELVARRGALADAAGVELTASERAILAAVSEPQLREMVAGMPPPSSARREFLRQSAASAVVLLGGAALVGSMTTSCEGADAPGGEPSPWRPWSREMGTEGGAAPHVPPPRAPPPPEPRAGEGPAEGPPGEEPPPRPEQVPMPAGIRPEPPPEPPEPTPPRPGKNHVTRGIRPHPPRARDDVDDPFWDDSDG